MWQDFVFDNANRIPDQLAIIDRHTGKRLTYAALDREVWMWTRHLLSRGIQTGDRVVYLAPNRLEHITLFFACARLGAILVPVNHRLAIAELLAIIERVEPKYFLGEGSYEFGAAVAFFQISDVRLADGELPKLLPVAGNVPLLMLFTSGSTGEPKGVLLHGDMLLANIEQTLASGVLQDGDISIVNTPFFHTGGYNVFCLPMLMVGGTLILFEKFEPRGVLTAIAEDGVNVFWAVPTMFQAIYDEPDFIKTDFAKVRFFLSGGAPLSLPLIQAYHRHGVPFKQGFGLTEVGPNCFLHETADSFERPDSIGRPMAHSKLKVVDENGRAVGVNAIGEMLIAGPHLCLGYWREEEKFLNSMRGEYFATGDLVRVDVDGFYYVVGRKKEMYISGGENNYPGEVERQLVGHPAIEQAVVVAVADIKWGEVGFAFYVGSGDVDIMVLREYLTPCLARYKHPHYIKRLAGLPLLANGKIDRRQLEGTAKQKIIYGP